MKISSSTVGLFLLAVSANAFIQPAFISSKGIAIGAATPSLTELNLVIEKKKSTISVQEITDEEVRSLFFLWNEALQTGDSSIVAKRYTKSPILLPTVSDTPRTDHAAIIDYFDLFLTRKPYGKIVDGYITKGINWAQDVGIYEFTLGEKRDKVMARYSFVYIFEDGEWKISHHHSSIMPEDNEIQTTITESEVRGLFELWNDALATGDPEIVASRYSANPCLLPTVSDTPRTDFAGLVDYFALFLKVKPQGVIRQSEVFIGHGWAQDAGIYDFTFGATGKKVSARYSFIYVLENGQWKVQHQHSSVLPEGIPGPAQKITKDEVRGLFKLWNNALATQDPNTVAERYSKEAVLIPPVADTPRNSDALIKDYFTSFLKKKPQGEIVSGNVSIGNNWAQDAGIYELTMGDDGSKVRARYSYVYVFEDGQWKISHHHSSIMPESAKGKVGAKQAVVNGNQWN